MRLSFVGGCANDGGGGLQGDCAPCFKPRVAPPEPHRHDTRQRESGGTPSTPLTHAAAHRTKERDPCRLPRLDARRLRLLPARLCAAVDRGVARGRLAVVRECHFPTAADAPV